jgi:hypothetical protein
MGEMATDRQQEDRIALMLAACYSARLKLENENERLRAALEELAAHYDEVVSDIARKALER